MILIELKNKAAFKQSLSIMDVTDETQKPVNSLKCQEFSINIPYIFTFSFKFLVSISVKC